MYIAYAVTASASNTAASLGARLYEAFIIMIIGMSAVFLMLIISMFGMMLIGKVASPKGKTEKETPQTQSSTAALESSSENTETEIAAAVAVVHHIRRKSVVSTPIIRRKDV